MKTAILLLAFVASIAWAQEEEPSPPPKKTGVKLLFIPPPMEGTFSLGIYDAQGHLVRTLKRDAETSDFGVALNGLVTYWDGKDDHGATLPAGKYSARGFCVGDVNVEGEAYFCNDWITDEKSPRISRVQELFAMPAGGFGISAQTPDKVTLLAFDAAGNPCDDKGGLNEKVSVRDGAVVREQNGVAAKLELPGLSKPTAAAPARNGGVWVVDESEVKEFSKTGEFLRRLALVPGAPVPVQIAASTTRDEIFLLEQDARMQRLRALALIAPAAASPASAPVSTWKVVFTKTITFSDTFDAVKGQLKTPDGKPFVPQEKVKLALVKNPLERKKPGAAEVAVGIDADGSFLRLIDGLPLTRLSDTAHLKWTAIARVAAPDSLLLFQSDGAVVEEFVATKLSKMMAFDCGEFDFDPARDK